MSKVVLGTTSSRAGKPRKFHTLDCRHAPRDPSPINVMDQTDALVWASPCNDCLGDRDA